MMFLNCLIVVSISLSQALPEIPQHYREVRQHIETAALDQEIFNLFTQYRDYLEKKNDNVISVSAEPVEL